ncbi:MAG: hypothetical protein JW852_03200 [Spirochaetales bacterium]|nr:hypothetical protein [Spirochaetales bacterium]
MMHHVVMLRKLCALLLPLSLLFPVPGHAEAFLGEIEVRDNTASSGLTVILSDVKIEGYQQRLITLAVSVTDAVGKEIVTEYYQFDTTQDIEIWDKLVFEFSEEALYNRFGEGAQDLYAVFTAAAIEGGASVLIPGGYHVRPVRLTIQAAGPGPGDHSGFLPHLVALSAVDPVFKRAIEVAEAYNIELVVRDYAPVSDTIKRQYSWRNLGESDNHNLIRSLNTVLSCIEELPAAFLSATGLQSVVFVGDVYFLGLDVGAGFDVNEQTVIIEVNDFFADEHLKNAFFHEYMHLIDSDFAKKGYFDNGEWASFNPPGSSYRKTGALAMIRDDRDFVSEEHPQDGFVNGYSLADIYQDKAEVFSWLFITPYYKKAVGWMRNDPFLKTKFDFMIDELGRISPVFTKAYFDALHR